MFFNVDDDSGEEFEMSGFGAQYLHFGEDTNSFFGASSSALTGELELCDSGDCFDIDIGSNGVGLYLGYDFGNLFTPFVSATYSVFETDLGFAEESDNDTSLGIGTFIGDVGNRVIVSLNGIDGEDQSALFGGYRTLDNNVVLIGSYETLADNPFSSYTLILGLGWSF